VENYVENPPANVENPPHSTWKTQMSGFEGTANLVTESENRGSVAPGRTTRDGRGGSWLAAPAVPAASAHAKAPGNYFPGAFA